MVWFTGTSTGDRYNVGQSYESAGRVYTAQADGSFSVNGSNRSVVGSSQDPTTVWGGWSTPSVGSGAAAYDGTASPSYGGGASAGQVYAAPAVQGPVMTTGPGNPAAQNDAPRGGPGRSTGPGGRSVVFLDPNREAMFPKDVPLKRTGDGGPQESYGAISDIGWARSETGYYPVPSLDVKERIEDGPMEWHWLLRNQVLPHLGLAPYPRPDFLDPAYSHLNLMYGEWRDGGNPRTTPKGRMLTGGGF